jgi:hypothetical protein
MFFDFSAFTPSQGKVCTKTITDQTTTTSTPTPSTTVTTTTTPTPPPCERNPDYSCPNSLDSVTCCPYEIVSMQNITMEFKRGGRVISRTFKLQYCCDVIESDYVQLE